MAISDRVSAIGSGVCVCVGGGGGGYFFRREFASRVGRGWKQIISFKSSTHLDGRQLVPCQGPVRAITCRPQREKTKQNKKQKTLLLIRAPNEDSISLCIRAV